MTTWSPVPAPDTPWEPVQHFEPLLDTDGNVIDDTDGQPIYGTESPDPWSPVGPVTTVWS